MQRRRRRRGSMARTQPSTPLPTSTPTRTVLTRRRPGGLITPPAPGPLPNRKAKWSGSMALASDGLAVWNDGHRLGEHAMPRALDRAPTRAALER